MVRRQRRVHQGRRTSATRNVGDADRQGRRLLHQAPSGCLDQRVTEPFQWRENDAVGAVDGVNMACFPPRSGPDSRLQPADGSALTERWLQPAWAAGLPEKSSLKAGLRTADSERPGARAEPAGRQTIHAAVLARAGRLGDSAIAEFRGIEEALTTMGAQRTWTN